MRRCKTCKTLLEIDLYSDIDYSSRIVDGNQTTYSHRTWLPCPNCGDPKWGDRPLRNWIIGIGGVIALVLIFKVLWYMTMNYHVGG